MLGVHLGERAQADACGARACDTLFVITERLVQGLEWVVSTPHVLLCTMRNHRSGRLAWGAGQQLWATRRRPAAARAPSGERRSDGRRDQNQEQLPQWAAAPEEGAACHDGPLRNSGSGRQRGQDHARSGEAQPPARASVQAALHSDSAARGKPSTADRISQPRTEGRGQAICACGKAGTPPGSQEQHQRRPSGKHGNLEHPPHPLDSASSARQSP